jgi:hypothetical protein
MLMLTQARGPVSNGSGIWISRQRRRIAALAALLCVFSGPRAARAGKDAAEEKSAEGAAIEQLTQSNQMLIQEIEELRARIAELDALKARVAEMEAKEPGLAASLPTAPPATAASTSPTAEILSALPLSAASPVAIEAPATMSAAAAPAPQDDGGHTMGVIGGPKLNIRGFLDFDLGLGSVANALIYPLTIPPTPVHNTFQFGEFDLFISSRLSNSISFLSEVVLGADASNFWGLDVERAQLSYKPSQYLQLSAGRMHTAMGYYNTAFHHGTWFQTATGRPYMYYFEDSGGILPVHIVGVEAAGLIPKTGKWNAHYVAEVGNGMSSLFIGQPIVAQPVQNFLSDKNHKAFNIAGYIRPEWLSGLQIGVNYYNDERVPPSIPHVHNAIPGAYLVYITPSFEFMNEFELQRDRSVGSSITYNTPLGYTQISHKLGKYYRPYFRWQEVNVPANDPLYPTVGRYEGPSVGLRMDFTDFAALKVQYNRIYTRDLLPANGVDNQLSFTF